MQFQERGRVAAPREAGTEAESQLIAPSQSTTLPTSSIVNEWRGRIQELGEQTLQQGRMIALRERRFAEDAVLSRDETGVFGSFHRMLTLSDPYELEIRNSSQRAAAADVAIASLDSELRTRLADGGIGELGSLIGTINQSRRLFGMRQIDPQTLAESSAPPVSPGLNRNSLSTEHYELEQEAITVSRDVAIDSIATVGTLGIGSGIGVAARGTRVVGQAGTRMTFREATIAGAQLGTAQGMMSSVPRATEEYQAGDSSLGGAVGAIVRDTATSAALGGGFGGAFQQAARAISRVRGLRARTTHGEHAVDDVAAARPGSPAAERPLSDVRNPRQPGRSDGTDNAIIGRADRDGNMIVENPPRVHPQAPTPIANERLARFVSTEYSAQRAVLLSRAERSGWMRVLRQLPEDSPMFESAQRNFRVAQQKYEKELTQYESLIRSRERFLQDHRIDPREFESALLQPNAAVDQVYLARRSLIEGRFRVVEEMRETFAEIATITAGRDATALSGDETARLFALGERLDEIINRLETANLHERALFGGGLTELESLLRRFLRPE